MTKDKKLATELFQRLQTAEQRDDKIPVTLTPAERELILYCLNYRFFPAQ